MDWGEFGLLGAALGAMFTYIAWGSKRLIGKDGIQEQHARALDNNSRALVAVASIVERQGAATVEHAASCKDANDTVSRLAEAAVAAVDEFEAEVASRGFNVSDRCKRVRAILTSH